MSDSFVTPLRYPGGKGRLGVWLAELIRHNGLEDGTYIEPYAGGAGAAVFLLVNNHVQRIIINDADPVIYAFWWAVLNDHEALIEKIRSTPVSMDSWNKQKEVIDCGDTNDLTQLGFATFFLNRTNRSGIITGGVIGGKEQTGKYKIDARYNKENLINRIRRIAILNGKIELHNLDAMELITHKNIETNNDSLIYLDPPYYNKGSQLYTNFYNPEDHASIADTVRDIKTPWLVTYDNCKQIRELYQDESGVEFALHYSTHMTRPKATEVLFYGNLFIKSIPTLKR